MMVSVQRWPLVMTAFQDSAVVTRKRSQLYDVTKFCKCYMTMEDGGSDVELSQFGISDAEYQVNIVKPPIYM